MSPNDRAAKVLGGDQRAAAQLMRDLDDQLPEGTATLQALYPKTGRAFVVGITGAPGAGKSTLVDELLVVLRARGLRVGVVAIDPTSPFSGGAILGDRIRMQRHTLDEGVFIRSLATRGQMGGLSRSTADVVTVLDALGLDVVFIETVGVGQDEVDVVRLADTVVVVTLPGLGDEVQALKAGLLEVADVLVVNKADREGADRALRDLFTMLELREGAKIEVIKTVAARAEGVGDLWTAIERHRDHQQANGGFASRRQSQAAYRVRAILADRLRREAEASLDRLGGIDRLAADVAERRRDPYSVADQVAR